MNINPIRKIIKKIWPPKPYQGWICTKPFEWFDVTPSGTTYLCCPSWLNQPVGDVLKQNPSAAWNSEIAQKIRASIIDGSYKYCNNRLCPSLANFNYSLIPVDKLNRKYKKIYEQKITSLPSGPETINIAFDQSCNLSCPSCRRSPHIANGNERVRVNQIIKSLEDNLANNIRELVLTGNGDPFGSPLIFNWMKTIDLSKYPKLRNIHLHTNAQLLTPDSWKQITHITPLIHSIEISIDAANFETYQVNRRGGDFNRLLKNLEFVRQLHDEGKMQQVTGSFVVQANNFRQIPAFIELCRQYHFDICLLTKILNWGTFNSQQYLNRAVFLEGHPEHQEYLELLNKVDLKNVTSPRIRTNLISGRFSQPKLKFKRNS